MRIDCALHLFFTLNARRSFTVAVVHLNTTAIAEQTTNNKL